MEAYSLKQARMELARLVTGAGIPGIGHGCSASLDNMEDISRYMAEAENVPWGMHQNFRWEQSWGVSCSLQIGWETKSKKLNSKCEEFSVPYCKVSWSSTERNLISARAAILLYTAVVDLATLIQTHFAERYIETVETALKREQDEAFKEKQLSLEARKDLIPDGSVFEILKNGKLEPDLAGIHWDESADRGCHGRVGTHGTSSDDACGAKTKYAIWHKETRTLLPRCGRHRAQTAYTAWDKTMNETLGRVAL